MPRFTTYDNLKLKLRGRLHIGTSPHVGGTVISEDDIEIIANQQETYLERVLGMIYEIPLAGTDPIIQMIAEDLICSQLMTISFQQTGFPSESSDVSNLAVNYRKNAESLLLMLTAGYNISIPGMPPVQQSPGVITPQPVILQGETLRTDLPDTISRNTTVLSRIETADGSSDPYGFFGLSEVFNPQRPGRARGVSPLSDWS